METCNRELGNELKVGVEASKVGGQQDLGSNGGEFCVGGCKCAGKEGSLVEDENRLIDLYPLRTSGLEIGEEGMIDGEKFWEKGNGLKSSGGLFGCFSEDKERYGAEDNRAGGDTCGLSFFEFFDSLVEDQFEVGFIGKLGDNEMVVRVKPMRLLKFNLNN